MLYVAAHSWRSGDITKKTFLTECKKIADATKSGKLPAKLHGTWLAFEDGRAWCVWETANHEALERLFASKQFRGMRTSAIPVEQVYPSL